MPKGTAPYLSSGLEFLENVVSGQGVQGFPVKHSVLLRRLPAKRLWTPDMENLSPAFPRVSMRCKRRARHESLSVAPPW